MVAEEKGFRRPEIAGRLGLDRRRRWGDRDRFGFDDHGRRLWSTRLR
jgi:hypothetical protein